MTNLMSSMMGMIMMMAPINDELYKTIRLIIFSLILLCAIFLVIVVLMQPGNSSGIGAISGETETFLGQNKSRTKEGVLKTLTIVAVVCLVVFSIAFFLVTILFPPIV